MDAGQDKNKSKTGSGSKRRAEGLLRRLDWIGFGAGLAAALIVWAAWHMQEAGGAGMREASKAASGTAVRAAADAALASAEGRQAVRQAEQDGQAGQAQAGQAGQAEQDGQAGAGRDGAAQGGEAAAASSGRQTVPQSGGHSLDELQVRVYLADRKRIETVPLETYVRGVVAAEMPLGFEPAALEAQALAARTYIVRRLLDGDRSGVPAAGAGADVTDTQTHQAYRSQAEMDKLKTSDAASWAKAGEAAKKTQGRILTYEGEPIDALYFSSSNGYTENSEDVFPFESPYLRSVDSPWDQEEAPDWTETLEMPLQDFYRKLDASGEAVLAKGKDGGAGSVRIAERTAGERVKTLQVGAETLTGTEAREKLGLKSAAFDLTATGRNVVITTYGSGHGVGMSQWGAEAMAKRGKTAEQIVLHYYTGIRIEEASKLADRFFL